jgi:hypothetical protein
MESPGCEDWGDAAGAGLEGLRSAPKNYRNGMSCDNGWALKMVCCDISAN